MPTYVLHQVFIHTKAQSGTGKACPNTHNAEATCVGGKCPEATTKGAGAARIGALGLTVLAISALVAQLC